jgi:dynein heavy chain
MRAIKSVLKSSGRIKREAPHLDEQTVIIKAVRDMNLPKFIAEDVVLFDNMFVDLFPECEEPEVDNDALQLAIEDCLIQMNCQLNENLIVKTMQLYESKRTRHGNMLVGKTMSGKTTAWQVLQMAMNLLHKEEKEKTGKTEDADFNFRPVHTEIVNPKAIDVYELYGTFDDGSPPQWKQGILSEVLKNMVTDKQDKNRWVLLDGPVDTLWIETMNSVLDDSKLLTL